MYPSSLRCLLSLRKRKKSLASPSLYISQSAVIRYFAVMAAARRFPAPDSSCCEGGKEMGKCDFATEFSFWQSNHAAASLSDPSANISGRIYVAASTTLSIFRPIQCNSNHFWELKKKDALGLTAIILYINISSAARIYVEYTWPMIYNSPMEQQ